MIDELLTFEDAAKLCRCSIRTLKRAAADDRLVAVRLGQSSRSDRIHPEDLESYINRQRGLIQCHTNTANKPVSGVIASSTRGKPTRAALTGAEQKRM